MFNWRLRLLRPIAHDWLGFMTLASLALYAVGETGWAVWLSNWTLGLIGLSGTNRYGLFAFSLASLGLVTIAGTTVGRLVWRRFCAPERCSRFHDASVSRNLLLTIKGIHVEGDGPERFIDRGFVACRAWRLDAEELSLMPLPSIRLATRELMLCIGIGLLGVAIGIDDLASAQQVPMRRVFLASALPFAAGIGLIGWCFAWATPLLEWARNISVEPGGVRVQTLFWTRHAAAQSCDLIVLPASGVVCFHVIMFIPHRGRPWTMVVPGRAIDLLIGAWSARVPSSATQ